MYNLYDKIWTFFGEIKKFKIQFSIHNHFLQIPRPLVALIHRLCVPHSWHYSNKRLRLLVDFFKSYHTKNLNNYFLGAFQNTLKFLGYLACILLCYNFFLLSKMEEIVTPTPKQQAEIGAPTPKMDVRQVLGVGAPILGSRFSKPLII